VLLEGFSFSLGLRRLSRICDDSRMAAVIIFFLGILGIFGILVILVIMVILFVLFMHIFVPRCCIGGSAVSAYRMCG